MAAIESTDLKSEEILVRPNVQNAMLYSEGTWKKGEVVSISESEGVVKYEPTLGPAGIVPVDMTTNTTIKHGAIATGEFSKLGVKAVMAVVDPTFVLDDKFLGECIKAGIFLN